MHTRRVGAFLIGAWLLGSVLVWFMTSQSLMTVDRILSKPPQALVKEINDMGADITRAFLRYEAFEYNRHISESWEVLQLGIGAALLATSLLTSHRSRILIGCTVAMMVMVAYMYFAVTPHVTTLGRAVDFLPTGAAAGERQNLARYETIYLFLRILILTLGTAIAARLLFDRYDWKNQLLGGGEGAPRRKRVRIKRRRTTRGEGPSDEGRESSVAEKLDAVDHPDNSRVDG